MVARCESDIAALDKLQRTIRVIGPTLEQDRANNRSAHRPSHALPSDRWAGMQQQSWPQARHYFAGDANALQPRLSREIGIEGLAIRSFNDWVIDEAGQCPPDCIISCRGSGRASA
jgi:hypothetical protein